MVIGWKSYPEKTVLYPFHGEKAIFRSRVDTLPAALGLSRYLSGVSPLAEPHQGALLNHLYRHAPVSVNSLKSFAMQVCAHKPPLEENPPQGHPSEVLVDEHGLLMLELDPSLARCRLWCPLELLRIMGSCTFSQTTSMPVCPILWPLWWPTHGVPGKSSPWPQRSPNPFNAPWNFSPFLANVNKYCNKKNG